MSSWMDLWCVLFLITLVALATGTESNAVSYWVEQGNVKFNQGNYTGAIYCYNKAIELGNQTNAPIFDKIVIQSGYRMDARDANDHTHMFSEILAGPTSAKKGQPNQDSEILSLSFDVTNPNSMHMRIANLYVDVIKYNSIINPEIIHNFGGGYNRGYFCNIEPAIRSYKCVLTSKDYDFIDLAPKELEHITINVNTDTPGVYGLRSSLDYAIGSETNSIVVGDAPGLIGFFDRNLIEEMS